jgi:hypothetical protein
MFRFEHFVRNSINAREWRGLQAKSISIDGVNFELDFATRDEHDNFLLRSTITATNLQDANRQFRRGVDILLSALTTISLSPFVLSDDRVLTVKEVDESERIAVVKSCYDEKEVFITGSNEATDMREYLDSDDFSRLVGLAASDPEVLKFLSLFRRNLSINFPEAMIFTLALLESFVPNGSIAPTCRKCGKSYRCSCGEYSFSGKSHKDLEAVIKKIGVSPLFKDLAIGVKNGLAHGELDVASALNRIEGNRAEIEKQKVDLNRVWETDFFPKIQENMGAMKVEFARHPRDEEQIKILADERDQLFSEYHQLRDIHDLNTFMRELVKIRDFALASFAPEVKPRGAHRQFKWFVKAFRFKKGADGEITLKNFMTLDALDEMVDRGIVSDTNLMTSSDFESVWN